MKILVTGFARHGKDTACEYLRRYFGLKFVSSSFFVAERAVRQYLAAHGIIYKTLEECYADRINHRKLWHDAILAYNTPDGARMARELFKEYDIYCGLRNREEFLAIQQESLYDVSVWVDRINFQPSEGWNSMQIRREDCDLILDNNTTLMGLAIRTGELGRMIGLKK